MPLCGRPILREHSPRTSGSVKLYDGRSQPQVVDLWQSATRLGKACVRFASVQASRQRRLGNGAFLILNFLRQRVDPGRFFNQRLTIPLIETLTVQQRPDIFEQLRTIVRVTDPIRPRRRRIDHINFFC